jgi:DNA-binding transcriptional LysR family regulator
MNKYQEIKTFVAVVDATSFVKAGETLGISKAAASRHISDLESRLGVRLLHRTTRALSLTSEGEIFLSRCREILSSIEASEVEISTTNTTATGLLKLNIPVSFGIQHLAPLWGEFLEKNPALTLDIQLTDRFVDLVDEGFDMAIRIGKLPDSSLVSRQIASSRMVLCASPKYIKKRGAPRHPNELSKHDVLAYSLLTTGDQWHFEGGDGLVRVKVHPRMSSNNGDSCVATCIAGGGIALQPIFLVHEALKSKQLVPLLSDFRCATLGIYAVYPTRKFLLPKVRVAVDFLTEKLSYLADQTL